MGTFKCSGCGKEVPGSGMTGLPHERCQKGGRWVEVSEAQASSESNDAAATRESVRQEFQAIQEEFGELHRRLIHAYKAADKLDRDDRPTQEDRVKAMQAATDFTDALIKSKLAIPKSE